MKKIALLFLLIISSSVYGQQLGAYFGFSIFHVPEETSFIETYISVMGETVNYQKINEKMQGKIQIEYNISENGKNIFTDSYHLLSPEINEGTTKKNFIEI